MTAPTQAPVTTDLSPESRKILGAVALLAGAASVIEYIVALYTDSAATMIGAFGLIALSIWAAVWWSLGDRQGWRDATGVVGFLGLVGFALVAGGAWMAVLG